ncbi:PAS domain S-box protein [uncultured Methylovirgula sp.]|uniref:PAS domain S-box protein n=1 Tax=uncultured Methylovirgula sp. TaxID=1285960 RepID=UPI0026242052|nr:PAS domain S-box protein [uncultured Methylovirgula sp.]
MDTSRKLLIVDRDPLSRELKVELLERTDLRLTAVETGREALRCLDAEAFDLIIVNDDAAEGDESAFYQSIKERSPSTAVLRMAHAASAKSTPAIDAAIDGFLLDPFEPSELMTLVRSLLRLNRARLALRDAEARLQLVQDTGGLAVVDCDLVTRRALWSEKFAQIFALPPNTSEKRLRFGMILNVVHPDDRVALTKEYRRLIREGGQFEREFRVRRADDGATRWISARGSFFRADGEIQRILCLCSDITGRKRGELRNAQLAAIVASSIDAIVSVDFDDVIRTWNYGAEQLFGYPAKDVIGKSAQFIVPDELMEERSTMMQRLMNGEAVEYQTRRLDRDGRSLDVWIRGAPVRSVEGNLFGASLIIRDITAQKQREEHVHFLMRELTHRSKNLLAVIQAMARQSLSLQTDPKDFVGRFSERLSSLAGSHDLLSIDDWAGASLTQLIRSQLQHFGDLIDTRILIQGRDVILQPEAAQNIGIVLHELSTNAAKFGALSVEAGIVVVSWSIVDDGGEPRMRLNWREEHGPPVQAPDHRGFGRMVMERIAGQALGGQSKATFAPEGVIWELDVPAKSVVREKAVEPTG